ncbi:hypothetical protein AB0V79_27150 [Mesorhizobium ciceri]|uniref:hypothetical protein n=1 Tax=Mesorhizobium ciceri TaxID=39645 RepID=UPI000AE222FF|nr:hypothetical protein [Mesorhizobium ciceri]
MAFHVGDEVLSVKRIEIGEIVSIVSAGIYNVRYRKTGPGNAAEDELRAIPIVGRIRIPIGSFFVYASTEHVDGGYHLVTDKYTQNGNRIRNVRKSF